MLVCIKCQLEGDMKMDVLFLSSSCCFAHVQQHKYCSIGENVHVCSNCMQHGTAGAIQSIAERRLERTAVEIKVNVQTETTLEENFDTSKNLPRLQLDHSLYRNYLLILRSVKPQVTLTIILGETRQKSTLDLGETKH